MDSCIKHLISEYSDAKEYYELAQKYKDAKAPDSRCFGIYRDLCENELEHFEKLSGIYKIKLGTSDNLWFDYFKHEVEELHAKLRQL